MCIRDSQWSDGYKLLIVSNEIWETLVDVYKRQWQECMSTLSSLFGKEIIMQYIDDSEPANTADYRQRFFEKLSKTVSHDTNYWVCTVCIAKNFSCIIFFLRWWFLLKLICTQLSLELQICYHSTHLVYTQVIPN